MMHGQKNIKLDSLCQIVASNEVNETSVLLCCAIT